jgi:predicted dehydrogenase
MTDSVGAGIVGCGGAAVDLVRAIDRLAGVHLVAAHDRVPALARDLAEPRDAAVADDLEALLAEPGVEVVYVALPHDRLAPVARAALGAGRHVLVEKPMALAVETIWELQRVAADRGRCLGVAFELRAAPAVVAARELIGSGAIGDVQLVRIKTVIDKKRGYWESGPTGRLVDGWRSHRAEAGGGVVLMNSIHQLDLLRFLTDLELVRAFGDVVRPAGLEVEDRASATIGLSNGGLLNLVASASSPGARAEERIEIDGTLGRIDLPDLYRGGAPRVFLRHATAGIEAERWQDVPVIDHDPEGRPLEPETELLRAFASAVREGSPPLAGARDAAAALAAVLAVYTAAATGHAVDIPARPREDQPDA